MNFSLVTASLAEVTLGISILLLFFLLLRPILRHAVGSRWLHVLWVLVLARLLVPVPVESQWSLFNLMRAAKSESAVQVPQELQVKVTVGKPSTASDERATSSEIAETQTAKKVMNRWDVLGSVWASGTALGVLLMLCQWLQTRRLAIRSRPASDPRLIGAFESIPLEWRAGVELRQTDVMPLATLAGVLKPQIWFPEQWIRELRDEELRDVLLHELGHARRHDLLAQWLFNAALCLHWFNPLVWIAVRMARFDREMACDSWVLRHSDEDGAEQYGSTLLRIVQLLRTPARLSPAVVTMAASRKTLGVRIRQISAFQQCSDWRGFVGICAMLGAVVIVTTTRSAGAGITADSVTPPSGLAAEREKTSVPDDSSQPTGLQRVLTPPSLEPRVEIYARVFEITESALAEVSKGADVLKRLLQVSREHPRNVAGSSEKPVDGPRPGPVAVLSSEELRAINAVFATRQEGGVRKTKGVELIAVPSMTAPFGEEAWIESGREFQYPSEFEAESTPGKLSPKKFETKKLGYILSTTATAKPNGESMDLDVAVRVNWLSGYRVLGGEIVELTDSRPWLKLESEKAIPANIQYTPVFTTRAVKTRVGVSSGQTVLLSGVLKPAHVDKDGTPVEARAYVVLLTAKILPGKKATETVKQDVPVDLVHRVQSTPAKTDVPEGGKPEYATYVPDKPGFVRSPYAPDAGFIDVRGFPPNTEIKCPYSGKIFRLPAPPPEKAPEPIKAGEKKAIVPDPNTAIEIKGEETRFENGVAKAEGDVVLRHEGVELFADSITYDPATRHANAVGKAILRSKGHTLSADTINYYVGIKTAQGLGNVDFIDGVNSVKGIDITLDLATGRIKTEGPTRTVIKESDAEKP